MLRPESTSKLDTLQQDTLPSEQVLRQQLQDLRDATRHQLQETQRRQTEELERRMQQDALLSSFTQPRYVDQSFFVSRNVRTSGQASDKMTSHKPDPSPARSSMFGQDSPSVRMSRTAQLEEEAKAECQKQFCAIPVPSHVTMPRYQQLMEQRAKERKQSLEERKEFLLAMQKPFSFQQREKEKREKLLATLSLMTQDEKTKVEAVKRHPQKIAKGSSRLEVKDQGLDENSDTPVKPQQRRAQSAAQQTHRESSTTKVRTADLTKRERLGFLDEKPAFQPKIGHQVPDFNKLHRALQTCSLKRSTERMDTTCQPFLLRTASLPQRQSRTTAVTTQEPKASPLLRRSRSLGVLVSLSADTLPTYITDAARKRCAAIRRSMELKESKKQESADWLRKQQLRSDAMRKNIAVHAKLLDPHSSLKEELQERLQQHREADLRRSRDYKRELRDIKARVSERPYLFQQVKQRSAKAQAEQMYRATLENAGLNEHFVEANGAGEDGALTSLGRDDKAAVSECQDMQSRAEKADDGEKIEDVEEESVKSKREEIP